MMTRRAWHFMLCWCLSPHELPSMLLAGIPDQWCTVKPLMAAAIAFWKARHTNCTPCSQPSPSSINLCHTPGPKLYAGPKPNPVFKPHPVLKANARSKQNLNLNEIQNRSNSRMDLDESNTTLSLPDTWYLFVSTAVQLGCPLRAGGVARKREEFTIC